jgi:hypothetical protein
MENKRLGKRPQRRLALKLWRMLKWTVISFSIVCALTVALFLGLIAYLSRNTCDDTAPSPVVRNSRAHTAEGQVQVCTWIGTVLNSYITMQIHKPTRIWPKKTLIDTIRPAQAMSRCWIAVLHQFGRFIVDLDVAELADLRGETFHFVEIDAQVIAVEPMQTAGLCAGDGFRRTSRTGTGKL